MLKGKIEHLIFYACLLQSRDGYGCMLPMRPFCRQRVSNCTKQGCTTIPRATGLTLASSIAILQPKSTSPLARGPDAGDISHPAAHIASKTFSKENKGHLVSLKCAFPRKKRPRQSHPLCLTQLLLLLSEFHSLPANFNRI